MEKELIDEFIRDFKSLLCPMDGYLANLAGQGGSRALETAEALFRGYHSLKGGAAVLGLEPMRVLAERLERIMAEIGEKERLVTPILVEAMRAATRRLKVLAESPDKAENASVSDELKVLEAALAPRDRAAPDVPPPGADLSRFGVSTDGLKKILDRHETVQVLTYSPDDFAPVGSLKLQELTSSLAAGGEILASRFREGDGRNFEVLFGCSLERPDLETLVRLPDNRIRTVAARPRPEQGSAPRAVAPMAVCTENMTPISQEFYGQIMLHANELVETSRRLYRVEKNLDQTSREMFDRLSESARYIMEHVCLKPEADGVPEHLRSGELPAHLPQRRPVPSGSQSPKRINVMLRDQEHAILVADQLANFGYEVGTFAGCDELGRALQNEAEPVAAVIVDMEACGATPTFELLGAKNASSAPIIFISDSDDLNTRIKALRSGGVAYFTTPVDLVALVEKIDKLTSPQDTDPFRVLIVDDQPGIAGYHESILKNHGMKTAVVTDPLQVLDKLTDFSPELVLMDVYMPGCTGVEIANVIRQKEEYVSIPIVYLSSESDVRKQMHAMSIGGDDFLTKPIRPDHLVAAVSSRAERYRILRSFMERDGMTGLLNHTNITERLQSEMSRAARYDDAFALAMLDIDKFKSVNDKYGHSTGDRVIKSLSRLLQQRLRRTDIIGRYGGEEFSVILINTSGEEGEQVFNNLRQAFSQIEHQYRDETFRVTFSCGIAVFNKDLDAKQLMDKADAALYEAKRTGRNRVILASD